MIGLDGSMALTGPAGMRWPSPLVRATLVDLVAKHRILEHQLASGPDHVNGDGSEVADLLAWRQLRPHPVHASQDPGPDSRDTWQPHPHLEHMKG